MPTIKDISAWVLGQSSGSLTSGDVLSGTLSTWTLCSGIIANHAQEVVPIYSGGLWTALTAERISGTRGVYVTSSGTIGIAMAGVSGKTPAIGVCYEQVESGIQIDVHVVGFHQFTSGLADFSGYLGFRVWLGRSGEINVLSGSWNSGGYTSGDVGQAMGQAVNSGAVLFNVNQVIWSGGPLGEATGGRK